MACVLFGIQILIDAKATRQALNEIESRHDEILKLERSIKDLHDMFQYLAMEVEAQVKPSTDESASACFKISGDLICHWWASCRVKWSTGSKATSTSQPTMWRKPRKTQKKLSTTSRKPAR